MSDTPLTDACFEAAQVLIRKYGTRDGVGPEFHEGNPWLLAKRLERGLAEARTHNAAHEPTADNQQGD